MTAQTEQLSHLAMVVPIDERDRDDTAQQLLTGRQSTLVAVTAVIALVVAAGLASLGSSMFGWHLSWHDYVDVPITLMLLVYVAVMVVRAVQVVSAKLDEAKPHPVETIDQGRVDWPSYSVLVPLLKEGKVVRKLIESLRNLDYPSDKLQIMLLLEKDDADTIDAIDGLMSAGLLPRNFEWVFVPEGPLRTKPNALNHGLLLATGQYLVIFDAEDVPEPQQLKKAVVA